MVKKRISKFTLRAHIVFATVAAVFGIFFVYAVPPFWGLDEAAHFGRAYQIANLNLDRSPDAANNHLPTNLIELGGYSWRDLANNVPQASGRKDVDSSEAFKALTSQKFSDENTRGYQVAGYSPVAYVGPILGCIISGALDLTIGQAITLARLLSLLTYVLIVGLAIYILRAYTIKWFIAIAALMPTALFNGSMISADTILISSSFLMFALFMKFLVTDDKLRNRKILLAILLLGVLIPLIKVNYALFTVGLIAAMPLKKVFNRHSSLIKIFMITSIILLAGLWYVISNSIPASTQPQDTTSNISPSAQMSFVLSHPLGFVTAIFRSIQVLGDSYVATGTTIVGWNYVSVPVSISALLCMVAFIVLIVSIKPFISHRKYLIIPSILSAAGIISVFLALYLAHSTTALPYVNGVQGRYFIPFILPIVALMACYLPIKFTVENEKRITYLALAGSLLILVWTALVYYMYTY